MFSKLLNSLSQKNQGLLALLMGVILVLGALGKAGILQNVLNLILIGVGAILIIWGLQNSNLVSKIKNLKK